MCLFDSETAQISLTHQHPPSPILPQGAHTICDIPQNKRILGREANVTKDMGWEVGVLTSILNLFNKAENQGNSLLKEIT